MGRLYTCSCSRSKCHSAQTESAGHKRLKIEMLYTFPRRDLYSRTTPYYAKGWRLCENIFAAGLYVVSCYDSSVGDKRLDLC